MGAAQSSRSTNAVIKSTAAATQLHDTGLAQNLRKIGQVNVQSPTEIQRSLEMTHVVRTRALSETDSPNGSTIDAFGLSEILDARKDPKKAQAAQMLSQRYKLDTKVIERLAKRYNTPSIAREYDVNLPGGDMRTYKEAVWLEKS